MRCEHRESCITEKQETERDMRTCLVSCRVVWLRKGSLPYMPLSQFLRMAIRPGWTEGEGESTELVLVLTSVAEDVEEAG